MKHLLPACCTLLMLLLPFAETITHAAGVQEQVQTTRKAQITDPDTNSQSSVNAENSDEKMYMEIGEMTVTGKSSDLSAADAPASVDVIGADQIEMQNVDFSMELLKKVPGFYYGDWNQGVVSGTVSLRGFDANHDAPATLIVDGIPHNFGYGRMDIQPFFPLEIDHIEAVKGTTDPRYGLLNIAGNINLHTKQGGNFTESKLLTGSFNTYDAGLITGHDDGNFSQTYFVGYRTTDGYRDHSDLEKGAASGKWFYTTENQKLSLGAIARVFTMDADAPGYLTKEEADSDPTKAADFATSDGGEQDNHHVSTHLDFAFSDDLIWSLKAYHQRIERTRWCKWSPTGTQQERYNDSKQYGAISTLSYELTDTFIPRLKLDWGMDYQHQDNIDARWDSENRQREGAATRYYDMDFYYWGSYIQADGDITDWLRLTASLRVDSFDGDMTNQLADLNTDMVDMDYIWQPKAGFVITPAKGYNFYGNFGRSFQLPSTPTLYGQNSSGAIISNDIAYSKNDGWELGIKASPLNWLSARVDYWQMEATDEVRAKNDGSGDYVNAGETMRKGWDFSISVKPHDWVDIWASYSIIQAEYTDPGPSLQAIKGNDIENIPDYTAKVGVDFDHPSGFFSNFWIEMQGDYEIDQENTRERDGAYDIVNCSLGYKWKKITIGLDINNIFDADYYSFIWDNDAGFNPGDGRNAYIWMSVKL